jgi:aminopeptidase N
MIDKIYERATGYSLIFASGYRFLQKGDIMTKENGRWRFFTLIFALFIALWIPGRIWAAEMLPGILEYNLDLKIDYETEKLHGLCEITLLNRLDRPIERIPLLLYRLMTVTSVENEKQQTLAYTQTVTSVSGWEKLQVNVVEITLNEPMTPNEQTRIKIAYNGYLLGYSETGWRYVKDHIDKNFTILRTDGFSYPVIGYPDDEDMWAIVTERYDYTIRVTVPAGLTAVTGGRLIDRTETGDKTTFVYHSKKPSWRLDIAISDYQILEQGKNRVCYFANDSLGARKVLHAMQTAFDLYTGWFCPLDDYQGISIIEIPEGYGSQQDITAIILTADNFKKADAMTGIYHEMAHSWNVKNLEPQPCRFESEGFAQFMQFLLSEKLDQKKNAVAEAAQRYLDRVRAQFTEHTEYQTVPIKDYGIRDMTDFSYSLGMVVFACLYDLISPDPFNRVIGTYYTAHHATGGTVDMFIEHCEELAPVDLNPFFKDWFYTTKGIGLVMEGKSYEELAEYYKKRLNKTSRKF